MSGLLFPENEDFFIQQGQKGEIMCHRIPGFSLILFYSTNCEYCHALIPIFKRLPGSVAGCQFGMVNVLKNKEALRLSQSTIVPIKYVPFIVLYYNGRPFISYKGPYDEEEIKRFIIDISNNIQKKQQFSREVVREKQQQGPEFLKGIGVPVSSGKSAQPVPDFLKGIGVPVCSGGVCYLEFDGKDYKINSK